MKIRYRKEPGVVFFVHDSIYLDGPELQNIPLLTSAATAAMRVAFREESFRAYPMVDYATLETRVAMHYAGDDPEARQRDLAKLTEMRLRQRIAKRIRDFLSDWDQDDAKRILDIADRIEARTNTPEDDAALTRFLDTGIAIARAFGRVC